MDNRVCLQQSKEEEIGEATKTIIRNIPNSPTTEEIDNITHAEMLQKATIMELKRRDRANKRTISKLRAEMAAQKRQIESQGVPQK